MITIPEDPVDIFLRRVHSFGLTLMDENVTISAGMKHQPNAIENEGIHYEWLPKEAIIRKRVARYRSSLRNGQRMMTLYFTGAARHLRRATRSASNR